MRAARRVLVVVGAAVMGYAVLGALTDGGRLFGVLLLLVAVLVGHDLILMPTVIGVGALVGRHVPARLRVPVRAALVIGLAITVVAVPLALGHRM